MAIAPATGFTAIAVTSPPASIAPPRLSDLVTEWRIDPLMLAVLIAAAAGYLWYRMRARQMSLTWPGRRDACFAIGVVAAVWVSCGAPEVRAARIEWVWIAQLLAVLLVVPFLLLAAQPVSLARAVGGARSPVSRIAGSRVVGGVGHPLVGPALVPVIFVVVLFGGVGQVAAASPAAGWALQVMLLLIGAAIALPLVDSGQSRTSMAIGLALAVGFFELILDVFPGIALRLAGHPVIVYFATHTPGWTAGWLYEQHQAGGLLWIASELLDLPFLILLAVRWVRVDAAEAVRIDAELDAAQARAGVSAAAAGPAVEAGSQSPGAPSQADPSQADPSQADRVPAAPDRPWFLDDQQLRDRYRF